MKNFLKDGVYENYITIRRPRNSQVIYGRIKVRVYDLVQSALEEFLQWK